MTDSIFTTGATLVLVAAMAGCEPASGVAAEVETDDPTAAYIEALDLEKMQLLGSDFVNPRYDAERIGKPKSEIDKTLDYDFDRLEAFEARLEGVDRRRVLEYIFAELTRDCDTNVEKHLAVLEFMHRVSMHGGVLRPIRRDGSSCFDPLLHLELNEMRCGANARLANDLFEAGGFDARRLAFGGHTAAEVHYDGDWHYIDADGCGGSGECVRDPDGSIPSWLELSRNPERLDAIAWRYELSLTGAPRTSSTPRVRSDKVFFGDATRRQEYVDKVVAYADDPDYGWDDLVRTPVEWTLRKREHVHLPSAVRFEDVEIVGEARARIRWRPARDDDGDLLGYRVFVSSTPRGWSYSKFAGTSEARPFWHDTGGWRPEMYDTLHSIPPEDLGRFETPDPQIEIDLPETGSLYATVMAFDAYHERVGKTLYLMSNELRIERPEP